MKDRPIVENAPGVIWIPLKDGWAVRWQARSDLVKRGYEPKSRHLCKVTASKPLGPGTVLFIQDLCNIYQNDMLKWSRGGVPVANSFDGTLRHLIDCFQTDKDSRYRKTRYATRKYYDTLCNKIRKLYGAENVTDIKARHLLRWHEELVADGKIAMGSAIMRMLRSLFAFGMTILEDDQCGRLCTVMHELRFEAAKPRTERLTADQANAVRAMAHQKGLHALALAQAFQFEVMLRQKDVIGEWVPISEPGTSDVTHGNEKWLRGIRWSEIDESLILRHVTSKRLKEIEFDLKNAPMVMEELARIGKLPTSGPIIVTESGLPFLNGIYRHKWRELANLCGIPKAVRNMDSRAGAISEATDAGADLEHVRHAATHSDIAMTQRYSRGSFDKVSNVQKMRVAHRNKT